MEIDRETITLAKDHTSPQGLDIQQVEGEGQLRPKAGEAKSIGGGELKWRTVTSESDDYKIDFNAIVGQVTDHSVAYAVYYIRSEAVPRGLQMLVGGDDESKVYLNGKEVFKSAVVPSTGQFKGQRVPRVRSMSMSIWMGSFGGTLNYDGLAGLSSSPWRLYLRLNDIVEPGASSTLLFWSTPKFPTLIATARHALEVIIIGSAPNKSDPRFRNEKSS